MKILVTGGAGFIGSHLVNALLARNHTVRILDALIEQVHGADPAANLRVPHGVEFIRGDVRDERMWQQALAGCDVLYHLAAEVGVGQSMYDIVRYMSTNTLGTAILLELLANKKHAVRKVIVASSMSIYGEGHYVCASCGPMTPAVRPIAQLEQQQWEILCPRCSTILRPLPTPEEKPLQPTSVYAISKRDQEELCLAVGHAYGIPTVALRFFNTYGSGQALSNPYTGVAAIFASRLLNGKPPLIFEDGLQSRDFVHVNDVVAGLLLAMEQETANYQVFNIGSGQSITVEAVARTLAEALGVDVPPQITRQFRHGDIRHCFADISKARRLLGYEPKVAFADGLRELVAWVKSQTAVDRVEMAKAELEQRGLTT
jgi:dTDP-L-rhamnose 4-epimerase